MLGPFDIGLLVTGLGAEVYIVAVNLLRKNFSRYIAINLYMLLAFLATIVQVLFLREYGWASAAYVYAYYYSDSLLTIVLYLAVMELYQHVFREMQVSKYVRAATILLLCATMAFSYLVVRENQVHLTGRFVVELGQNLYFVGVVLTYLLWGAVMKLHETRTRLIQLILALGIYFSATAAAFAFRNLFPSLQAITYLQPIAGTFLPIAWGYTFTAIPEEARLVTARLVPKTTP